MLFSWIASSQKEKKKEAVDDYNEEKKESEGKQWKKQF